MTPRAPKTKHSRWLTGLWNLGEAISNTSTFAACVNQAGVGEAYEDQLAAALVTASADISAQLPAEVDGLGKVASVQFTLPQGRAGRGTYDLLLIVNTAKPLRVPVNIKRNTGAPRRDRAVSASAAFETVLGDPEGTTAQRRDLHTDRLLLRSGRRRLRRGDYLLLCVEGPTDTPTSWWFQGLVGSTTTTGGLASRLHKQDERVTYVKGTAPIADGVDIAWHLAEAWGRPLQYSELREQLWLAAQADGASRAELRALAGALLDSPEDSLLKAVAAALTHLGDS